jgi:single-strand DNA-binding protein
MAGINKVILVGNLGRDPEVRYSQSGMAICTMSLAVTERVRDGNDGWKDQTEWFRIKAFGKHAENAGQYLEKGRQLYVEGRLHTEKYKDKEGLERLSIEVIANSLQFLGGKRGRSDTVDAPAPGAPDQEPAGEAGDDGFIADDLPF